MEPPHIPNESILCRFTKSGLLELSRRCIPDKPQQRWENFSSALPPALPPQVFPHVTNTSETQKRLDPGKKTCPDTILQPSLQKFLDLTPHLSPLSELSGGLPASSPLVPWTLEVVKGISTCNSTPNLNPSVLSGTPRAIFRIPNKYINCFQFISCKSICLITIHLEFVFLMVYGYCW